MQIKREKMITFVSYLHNIIIRERRLQRELLLYKKIVSYLQSLQQTFRNNFAVVQSEAFRFLTPWKLQL